MISVSQGDIIKAEGIKDPLIVVSKDYYHNTNHVIVCPIIKANKDYENAINIIIKTDKVSGMVLCDQPKNLDLTVRGYQVVGSVSLDIRMTISDIIQGLFEY